MPANARLTRLTDGHWRLIASVLAGLATFQVSDTTVKTARLRNLITAHAATAYLFNTAILALGINIIATLVGK